jgi:hypothetical protein
VQDIRQVLEEDNDVRWGELGGTEGGAIDFGESRY